MLFLVRIDLSRALEIPTDERANLRAMEGEAARELGVRGVLVRLWRRTDVAWGNIGLWRGQDRNDLLRELSRLPLYPWMHIEVEALEAHPSDPKGDDRDPE